MFSSELPCAIMRILMPFLATVENIFDATPRVPFMLAPITAITATSSSAETSLTMPPLSSNAISKLLIALPKSPRLIIIEMLASEAAVDIIITLMLFLPSTSKTFA